jgi:hypothetical protein
MLKLNQLGWFGVLFITPLLGGCALLQPVRNSQPAAPNPTPLVVDQAMQVRDWDRVTAAYSNGDTIAGPTGFPYEARWYQPEWRYAAIEPPLFVGQSVALPVTLIFTPPWTAIRYTGETVETSYTAMPPLP